MLVLMRRVGERIVLDGGITVQVTRVAAGRIWLGFDAPTNVKILREEIARPGECRMGPEGHQP